MMLTETLTQAHNVLKLLLVEKETGFSASTYFVSMHHFIFWAVNGVAYSWNKSMGYLN